MLSFASLLCQTVCKLFTRCCRADINSAQLVHLLELLETVGGNGLRSVVMNEWRVVAIFVRHLGRVGLAELVSELFGCGLARSQPSTAFERHHLHLVKGNLLASIRTHGSLLAEAVDRNLIAASSHCKLTY